MADRNVRYGAEIRKRADAADRQRRSKYACPKCGKKMVKRSGNSLWACKACGARIAGGAYALVTPTGEVAGRQVEAYKQE